MNFLQLNYYDILSIAILTLLSISDICNKQISLNFIMVFVIIYLVITILTVKPFICYEYFHAFIVFGILSLVNLLFYITRGYYGIGTGDIYLFSALAIIYSIKIVLMIINTSSIFGIFYFLISKRNKDKPIPFVPCIFIGLLCTIWLF